MSRSFQLPVRIERLQTQLQYKLHGSGYHHCVYIGSEWRLNPTCKAINVSDINIQDKVMLNCYIRSEAYWCWHFATSARTIRIIPINASTTMHLIPFCCCHYGKCCHNNHDKCNKDQRFDSPLTLGTEEHDSHFKKHFLLSLLLQKSSAHSHFSEP